MESLAKEGISSFKIYMTYDFKLDDVQFKVLKKAKELGIIIAVHAENNDVINDLRKICFKWSRRNNIPCRITTRSL